jgi:NTE family protein
MGEQVLVDGGSVNPVPYDLLQAECDIVIAVDVLGERRPGEELLPSYTETIFNTFQISEQTIVNEKIKASPPSIYVEPGVENVKVLEFHKAPEIYEQARPAAEQMRKELTALLG